MNEHDRWTADQYAKDRHLQLEQEEMTRHEALLDAEFRKVVGPKPPAHESQTDNAGQPGHCPKCGSNKVLGERVTFESAMAIQPCTCACGKKWTDYYRLSCYWDCDAQETVEYEDDSGPRAGQPVTSEHLETIEIMVGHILAHCYTVPSDGGTIERSQFLADDALGQRVQALIDLLQGGPRSQVEQLRAALSLGANAFGAAMEYDKAIRASANDPFLMASSCTAQGETLDTLYAGWLSATRKALSAAVDVLDATKLAQAPRRDPDPPENVADDGDFLCWVANRLTCVHGDRPGQPHVQRLYQIAKGLPQ